MAGRPPKSRIDYAGWSVDIFDGDTKIDRLIDAHGWVGFGIYFYLCQKAYGTDGYFYKWGFADGASTARRMGGGIGSGTITEVVSYCLQIGLYSQRVFDRWGVLTSKGIQKRYYVAANARRGLRVATEYWLLSDEEAPGLLKCTLNAESASDNSIITPDNSIITPDNSIIDAKRKGKEIKGKERELNADERPDFDTVEVYASTHLDSLSPREMRELTTFAEDIPDELIRHAIDVACKNGVRRFSYVRKVLNRYAESGYKTVAEVEAETARYMQSKQPAKPTRPERKIRWVD